MKKAKFNNENMPTTNENNNNNDDNVNSETTDSLILIAALKKIMGETGFLQNFNNVIQIGSSNKLLVNTKQTREDKYKLRDNFLKNILNVSFENLEGRYAFYVNLDDLAKNSSIQEKIKTMSIRLESKENEVALTTSIYFQDNIVGRIIINNSASQCPSIARLDVGADYRGQGYGTILMDFMIDFCIRHGSSLSIDVDKARNEKDDPLVFYTKYFNSNGIHFQLGTNSATKFFGCQKSISVPIQYILEAKFPGEYAQSALTAPQFLGMKFHGLSREQVNKEFFTRNSYLSLNKGEAYSDILALRKKVIGSYQDLPVAKIELFIDFDNRKLDLLQSIKRNNPNLLSNDDIFAIIKKLPLDKFNQYRLPLLVKILNTVELEKVINGDLGRVIKNIYTLTDTQFNTLKHVEIQFILNEDVYKLIQKTNEEVLQNVSFDPRLPKGDYSAPLDQLQNIITQVEAWYITKDKAMEYKSKADSIIATFSKRDNVSEEFKNLVGEYQSKCHNFYLGNYDHRKQIKDYSERLTAMALDITQEATTPGMRRPSK